MATTPARRRRESAHFAGSGKAAASVSPARLRAWISRSADRLRAPASWTARYEHRQSSRSRNPVNDAVDAAEEIRDPLDGLVEKTAIDPGAPFAPDTLGRLAAL
jgi:hypothetical protein